jgi:hypothetical protein
VLALGQILPCPSFLYQLFLCYFLMLFSIFYVHGAPYSKYRTAIYAWVNVVADEEKNNIASKRDDTENENVTKLNFVYEIRLCHIFSLGIVLLGLSHALC